MNGINGSLAKKQVFFRYVLIPVGIWIGITIATSSFTILAGYFLFKHTKFLSGLPDWHLKIDGTLYASVNAVVPVSAGVDHTFKVHVKDNLPLLLPIRANIQFPIDETIDVCMAEPFHAKLNHTIHVEENIKINGEFPLDSVITAKILGVAKDIPIKGTVPLKISFPLNQGVKVIGDVLLDRKEPIPMQVKQNIKIPIDVDVKTVIPVDEYISVPIKTIVNTDVQVNGKVPVDLELDVLVDWDKGITIHRIERKII